MMLLTAPTVTASLILAAGLVDDLRSRKFHNWLFLICAVAGLAASLIHAGLNGIPHSLWGLGAAVAISLPLVLFKIVGAGDLKLIAAFGLAAGWNAVLSVVILSILWGAVFGILQVIISGQGKTLLINLWALAKTRESKGLTLHRIPYAVPLFVAWLTFLVREGLL